MALYDCKQTIDSEQSETKISFVHSFVFCSIRLIITSAVKYPKIVIPANAGIQINTGCRIKSGMTKLIY